MQHDIQQSGSIRIPDPAVSRLAAIASLELEHFSASFIVDASYFLAPQPSWQWSNLKSLALTSTLLTPDERPAEISAMLEAAAAAATKMPLLRVMEIWNGRRGLAALFKYRLLEDARQSTVTWKSTWESTVTPFVLRGWEAVARQRGSRGMKFVEERLDEADIQSHDDAVYYLRMSNLAFILPVSLQHIEMEQKMLEGDVN